MNTLMNFLLLLCQSCHSLKNVFFGGRILGLVKCACHIWLTIIDVIRGAPLLVLPRAPNLKTTTGYTK